MTSENTGDQDVTGQDVTDQGVTDREPARPVFTRTQMFGLLLMAAGPGISWISEVAVVGAEALGLFATVGPPIVLSLLGAGLAWRFGIWAKVLGVIFGLALLGLFGPFLIGGLTTINSVLDFVPALLAIVGALIAVFAGIAAIVRRADLRVAATATERRIQTVGMAVLLVLAVVSGVATWLGVEQVEEEVRAGSTEIDMAEFEFQPDTLEVTAGESTRVVLHNSDHVLHTFTVDELDVDVTVTPGSDGFVEFDAPPGTYRIYCRPHSEPDVEDPEDAGMVATLEVD